MHKLSCIHPGLSLRAHTAISAVPSASFLYIHGILLCHFIVLPVWRQALFSRALRRTSKYLRVCVCVEIETHNNTLENLYQGSYNISFWGK